MALAAAVSLVCCAPDQIAEPTYVNPLADIQGDAAQLDSQPGDDSLADSSGQVTSCKIDGDCPAGQKCDPMIQYCYKNPCAPGTALCLGGYAVTCGADGASLVGAALCGKGTTCLSGKCVASGCGDGSCSKDAGENCSTCPSDCGKCPSGCGDSVCDPNESCKICPADCGACTDTAGCQVSAKAGCDGCACESCVGSLDPACVANAWDAQCVALCQKCGTKCANACGDGLCGSGENCGSCPKDCGTCGGSCGDGLCDLAKGESCNTCAKDCGSCPSACGDGQCDAKAGESCTTCAQDCGTCPSGCGDGQCDPKAA